MGQTRSQPIIATITNVVNRGSPTEYIVFVVKRPAAMYKRLRGESVTVSHRWWLDKEPPAVGADAVIDDVRHHHGGWRAYHARFWRP